MNLKYFLFLSLVYSQVILSQDHEHNDKNKSTSNEKGFQPEKSSKKVQYTCPMHPQIISPEPGNCPICGMELVPMKTEDSADNASDNGQESISISKASRRLAGIEIERVQKEQVHQIIHAVGSIDFDEGRVSTISAYVDGRIEKLYADYTGVLVKKNEHLAEFYSPNLYSAQVEYLQAQKALKQMGGSNLSTVKNNQVELLKGAEVNLKELGMTPYQIKRLKETGKANSRLTLVSQVTGTVIDKKAIEGDYVKKGQVIYKVADLSTVWLHLDLFPEETTYLRFGLKVKAHIRSAPDREFVGRVSFINPVINKKTRTVRVRVEIPNQNGLLKPGDYADATIEVPVGRQGLDSKIYDKELAGKYISPMHPQIISDKPGKCPICGMDLVPASEYGYSEDESTLEKVIVVPRDSVLTVGSKSVVFVESSENRFSLKEVTVGQSVSGNRVIILDGLKEDEKIATSGVFLIDSQMQLSGKTSLMQITGNKKTKDMKKKSSEHNHQ